jgi:predicted GNAT family N-acyltransferase
MADFALRRTTWSEEDAARLQEVRFEVFVREQGVPLELEWDEFDPVSRHVLAISRDGHAVGTGRLLPDGHIGRMAVRAAWRRHGVGSAILSELLAMAREDGHDCVVLHAQTHATGFYARYGFEPEGEEFLEAGIPHRAMRRHLVSR